jgi:16S rRNA G966 N2-methylase RsmD
VKEAIDALPDTITAPRTDPIYNCHAYLTKVPIGAIKPFIETFSNEGETVADIFAGSGMTGLAALSSGRNAKLSDISALGQHIAKGYLQNMPDADLLKAGTSVVDQARAAIGDLYQTNRESDGQRQEMVRAVWSFTYVCPSCNGELVYYDHLDEKGKAPSECPSCSEPFVKRLWGRAEDVPVRIVVNGENKKQAEQDVSDADIKRINKAAKDKRQQDVPSKTIDKSREMYSRSGLGKAGMTETSMFFSPRNAIALLELWNAINEIKNRKIKQKLRFAFTAILPRASRRYQWSPKRPLNAQNQTYYIAPVYYEWNVFELFMRKINASMKANAFLFGELTEEETPDVSYDLSSADNLKHLDDASIDYIFTDPPFGSNIFYSDMNLFHEAWLGKTTNHKSEAVVHTTGKKKSGAQDRYETLLRDAFKEAYRALKPGKYMSVVFGNSSGKIWGLVQRAMRDAGFKATPAHVSILDKGQRSVKGLNSGSEGVVTVDLVITVQKPVSGESADDGHILTNGDTAKLIKAAVKELSSNEAQNPSHVYARILRKAIQQHIILDDLHLGDVLIALRNAGYAIDRKTGKLYIEGSSK